MKTKYNYPRQSDTLYIIYRPVFINLFLNRNYAVIEQATAFAELKINITKRIYNQRVLVCDYYNLLMSRTLIN